MFVRKDESIQLQITLADQINDFTNPKEYDWKNNEFSNIFLIENGFIIDIIKI